MAQFWKDAHDEGGLAWDDSNNNRAFLSGDISASLNGASIYVAALNGADKFKTDKGAPLHTDILHAPLPAGPRGARLSHRVQPHGDEVLEERQGRDGVPALGAQEGELREVVRGAEGLSRPARRASGRTTRCGTDPVMLPFKTAPRPVRLMGFAGAPTRRPRRRGTSTSSVHVRECGERQDDAGSIGQGGRGRVEQDLYVIVRP
jgi:multiple sugar transport system substrate-binding protein